jgi:hypothetical protein
VKEEEKGDARLRLMSEAVEDDHLSEDTYLVRAAAYTMKWIQLMHPCLSPVARKGNG